MRSNCDQVAKGKNNVMDQDFSSVAEHISLLYYYVQTKETVTPISSTTHHRDLKSRKRGREGILRWVKYTIG